MLSGVQVTLVGESDVVFEHGEATPVAVNSDFGRFLFVSPATPGTKFELNLQGVRGELELKTADAVAAVETAGYLPPGADPLEDTPIPVTYVYCLSGSIAWRGAEGEPVPIELNRVRAIVGEKGSNSRGAIKLPNWVDARKMSTLDRDTAKLNEALLPLDRPLLLALEEQAGHRRIELRAHVARSLIFLESYQRAFQQLTEEEYKSYWSPQIELLRSQIARGKDVAGELKSQWDKSRGTKDGALLYRLLRGFSDEQLINGEALLERLYCFLSRLLQHEHMFLPRRHLQSFECHNLQLDSTT